MITLASWRPRVISFCASSVTGIRLHWSRRDRLFSAAAGVVRANDHHRVVISESSRPQKSRGGGYVITPDQEHMLDGGSLPRSACR
ncbi:hypothetical protein L596_008497 [Steinernema carpocapsae]|uniref:Uncharacterized protein n=1 Tax=Steinernema carpocapsae TaxID=34508 RepID=A0A4U5PCY1_STECR|nr:hypothetical protein L596_008497 [Steinernema carpocapsae]